MTTRVTNNAYATLAASITTVQTQISLQPGQGALFPVLAAGDWFWATMQNALGNMEVVKVTGTNGDTMTCVRASDNTTAYAFNAGDRFELRPTAALFNDKLNVTDAANTYATKSYSDTTYLNALTGGPVTGNVQLKLTSPQLQFDDTSQTAGAGCWRFMSTGGTFYLQRSTDTVGGYGTTSSPLTFSAGDVATFSQRPTWAGATPWDSGNLQPLDLRTGGTINATLAVNGALSVGGGISSTNGTVLVHGFGGNGNAGVVYLNAANNAYHYFDGSNHQINNGSIYNNGNLVWTSANLTNNTQLANGMGYLTSVSVAANRNTNQDAGYGVKEVSLENVNGNTVRLVVTFMPPPPA